MLLLVPLHAVIMKAVASLRKMRRASDDTGTEEIPKLRPVLFGNHAGCVLAVRKALVSVGVQIIHVSNDIGNCAKEVGRLRANSAILVAGDVEIQAFLDLIRNARQCLGEHIGLVVYWQNAMSMYEKDIIIAGADLVLSTGLESAAQLGRLAALGRRLMFYVKADKYSDLYLDGRLEKVYYREHELALSERYVMLLRLFVENADQIVSVQKCTSAFREQRDLNLQKTTVVAMVHRLRNELHTIGLGHKLRTIKNMGYVWDSD
jgi:DNA-binding response OmpR family regulator